VIFDQPVSQPTASRWSHCESRDWPQEVWPRDH